MPIIIMLLSFLLVPTLVLAEDIYVAQNARGFDDGASCANAHSFTWFNTAGNWGVGGGKISAGDTAHLCGSSTIMTNTVGLGFQGSGTSGNPITLLFETGAVLTSAAWPNNGGAIDAKNRSFIVIDGGTNGLITATANGSGLANQLNSRGIEFSGSDNIEIKNLTISHLYDHTSTTDTTMDVQSGGCLYANGVGDNILIHHNTISDGPWCIDIQYNGTSNNIQIYNNALSRVAHGITLGATAASGHITNISIHDNHIFSFGNWATTTGSYHLTGVHLFGVPGSTMGSAFDFYNNLFDGTWGNAACPTDTGSCITAFVFIEAGASEAGVSGLRFFNNVGVSDAPINNGLFGIFSGPNSQIYNNTMVGSTTSTGVCFYSNRSLTGIQFKNNVMTTCNQLIGWTGTFAAGSPDFNVYGNGGGNAFHCGSNFYSFAQFASWKTCAGSAQDANSSGPNSAGLTSAGVPQAGSPLLGAGANLTILGNANLNKDKMLIPRPSAGAWSAGAYNVVGDTVSPAPPTNLMVQ